MGKRECDFPPLIQITDGRIECTDRRYRRFKENDQCLECDGFSGPVAFGPRRTKIEIALFEIRDKRRFTR